MLEAVGHKYLGAFFSACDRLLKPQGIMALQVITIPDQRYDAYRKSCDWIQKHIFPGALLPSLGALCEAMKYHSHFVVEHLENIADHYVRTLYEWRMRFQSQATQMENLGFGAEFQRTWEYYFCYCEAAFAARVLGDLQIVLRK
jgi:cyclopropane-fatty-acyl-phospholipid synthase